MEENGCPNFRRLFTTKFIKSHVKLPIKSYPQKVNSIADTLSSCKFQPPFQKQHPSDSFAFGPATCSLTQKANSIWWMVWLIQLKFINFCTIDDYVNPNGSSLPTKEQTLLHCFLLWLGWLFYKGLSFLIQSLQIDCGFPGELPQTPASSLWH